MSSAVPRTKDVVACEIAWVEARLFDCMPRDQLRSFYKSRLKKLKDELKRKEQKS